MEITYPYKMTINSKEEAYDAIMNMCKNCDRSNLMNPCSGAQAMKCNETKDKIAKHFKENEKYICKANNDLECIKCNPGPCESRETVKEHKDRMSDNDVNFLYKTSEMVPFIQRLQSTVTCVEKTHRTGDNIIDLGITFEELQTIDKALLLIKEVRERAFKQIHVK